MDWPILYKHVLHVKDPANPVGVAIMWTERQVVADLLKGENYCAIGNLYSSAGISAMIRNIYANPHIRKIVLWGADLSRSGQALLSLMQNGVDESFFIVGDEKKGQIEKEIGRKNIELFRKSVKVVNLRGRPVSEFVRVVSDLRDVPKKPFTKPQVFPTSRPKPFTYPSEQIGFRIHGQTAAQTWLKILQNIMRYGRNKTTRYTQENELKELLNVMAVVYKEDPEKPYLPHYFPFTEKDLSMYYPQVLSPKQIPGIAYTYGQRLRAHDGVDQIQNIIDLIKTRPFSKKMVAFTAKVKEDWSVVNKGDTPCLTQVLVSIQDGKLFMTTHFRSQDMVHGWPRNVFSLRKLQKLIADETGYPMGTFVMITHSAHIYSDDYELVENILRDNYAKELGYTSRSMFEEDLRGNFTVEIEKTAKNVYEIVVKLYAPNGGLLLKEWRGRTAMELYIDMINIGEYLVMPSHLVYLGSELQRAEYAIKTNQVDKFSQDPAANKEL
ncbi:MAG: Thymidylate synthase [Microgenomates group bacterium GW2011_GWA2_46_7]|nr:MAG: Thymidylate synthase [Microgenomates group bacterium GW2011_GWA2_46_7]